MILRCFGLQTKAAHFFAEDTLNMFMDCQEFLPPGLLIFSPILATLFRLLILSPVLATLFRFLIFSPVLATLFKVPDIFQLSWLLFSDFHESLTTVVTLSQVWVPWTYSTRASPK